MIFRTFSAPLQPTTANQGRRASLRSRLPLAIIFRAFGAAPPGIFVRCTDHQSPALALHTLRTADAPHVINSRGVGSAERIKARSSALPSGPRESKRERMSSVAPGSE